MNLNGRKNNKKSFSKLLKINNSRVLNEIFSFVKKKDFLNIIRYSKKLQKNLNINIHLYKLFSELCKYKDESDEEEMFNKVKSSFLHSPIFKDEVLCAIKRFIYDQNNLHFCKVRGFTLRGHYESVLCLIQLRNGKICSGSLDKTIKIWNISSHKCEKTLSGHTDDVSCVMQDVSRDNILYSGSDDLTVRVWDIEQEKCLFVLNGHSDVIFSMCGNIFNPHKKDTFICTGADDSTIRVWDVTDINSCKEIKVLKDHTSSVATLCTIDENYFASGSCDEKIIVWRYNSFDVLKTLEGHKGTVYSLLYIPTHNTLLSGAEDRTIKFWSIESGECLYSIENAHKNDITSFSYDIEKPEYFFSSSIDQDISRWNIKTHKKEYTLQGHHGPVNTLLSLNNHMLGSGSEDGNIKIWNLAVPFEEFPIHNGLEAFVELHQGALVYKHIKVNN